MIVCGTDKVAKILEVSVETVQRWIRDNELKADRGRGRNGNNVLLEDVVEFANKKGGLYKIRLIEWLRSEKIPFLYEDSVKSVNGCYIPERIIKLESNLTNGFEQAQRRNTDLDYIDSVSDKGKREAISNSMEQYLKYSEVNLEKLIIKTQMELSRAKQEYAKIQAEIACLEEELKLYGMIKKAREINRDDD